MVNTHIPSNTVNGSLIIQNITISGNQHGVLVENVHDVTIRNGVIRNHGHDGVYVDSEHEVTIQNINLSSNRRGIHILVGGEITIKDTFVSGSVHDGVYIVSTGSASNVNIQTSSINGNGKSGFQIDSRGEAKLTLSIINTSVHDNDIGLLLMLQHVEDETNLVSSSFTLNSCNISRNTMRGMQVRQESFGKTSLDFVVLADCLFQGNGGGGLSALFTDVYLEGNIAFADNMAIDGGALSLESSVLHFNNNSNIILKNNRAKKYGGAVFVSPSRQVYPLSRHFKCFYSINIINLTITPMTPSLVLDVILTNNSALFGGDEIFGASWESCTDSSQDAYHYPSIIRDYVHIDEGFDCSLSLVTSDPTRVCLCDETGQPQCNDLSYIFHTETCYPGERFNLSLVVVGLDFGTLTTSVYASTLDGQLPFLPPDQHFQSVVHTGCTQVEYSVPSPNNNEVIVLTANERRVEVQDENEKSILGSEISSWKNRTWYKIKADLKLFTTPVYVNVTLKDCPLGFNLAADPEGYLSCQCHPFLIDNGITNCYIQDETGFIDLDAGRTLWIGNGSLIIGNSEDLVVAKYCPYDYCNKNITTLDLSDPDEQCALNHMGVLCGGCLPNHSLALGSNQCLPCSDNNHLALLVFFIVAGLLLVFFIKFLDLTVANGTINGLLFYANIVWAYKSLLFPARDGEHSALQFFRVFIAWLNLDFGIETCFFQGLTAYWKTWLQFVFPLYIWIIAGVVIGISHYSTVATKLFGKNSVPVLATLFLISYSKLLRTIITVFGYAELKSPIGTIATVWDFDGNIHIFGKRHAPLLVIALLVLLLLWLPYTMTILLVPLLRRKSHLKPLHWINKWKPFYDAYFGPLKDKHHYWVGVLLSLRGLLLVIFSITSSTHPQANLLVLTTVASCLIVYLSLVGRLYKKWYWSILENSFFLNLAIIGVATFYQQKAEGDETPVIYTSVIIVFIQFIAIVLFHICCAVKKCCFPKKKDEQVVDNNRLEEERAQRQRQLKKDIQTGIELREPFL